MYLQEARSMGVALIRTTNAGRTDAARRCTYVVGPVGGKGRWLVMAGRRNSCDCRLMIRLCVVLLICGRLYGVPSYLPR